MSVDDPVALGILEYLSNNPDAEDSLEDIAGWKQQPVGGIHAAIDDLAKQGLVLPRRRSDGSLLYCINPGKREQVRRFLARSGKP